MNACCVEITDSLKDRHKEYSNMRLHAFMVKEITELTSFIPLILLVLSTRERENLDGDRTKSVDFFIIIF